MVTSGWVVARVRSPARRSSGAMRVAGQEHAPQAVLVADGGAVAAQATRREVAEAVVGEAADGVDERAHERDRDGLVPPGCGGVQVSTAPGMPESSGSSGTSGVNASSRTSRGTSGCSSSTVAMGYSPRNVALREARQARPRCWGGSRATGRGAAGWAPPAPWSTGGPSPTWTRRQKNVLGERFPLAGRCPAPSRAGRRARRARRCRCRCRRAGTRRPDGDR